MTADSRSQLSVLQRRQARRMAYRNAGLWGSGNGLISGTLVIYLATELGAPGIGLGVSLIKAAPQLAGLLRLVAPALIGRLADRKRFCIGSYLLSTVVLSGLPLAAVPGWFASAWVSLVGIVLLWCTYHLLEYLGTVALWAWLADLVPLRIRGRFLGRRERWRVAGQAASMLATALFSIVWNGFYPKDLYPGKVWAGYAIPAALGVGFLIASLLPLAAMPASAAPGPARAAAPLRAILSPFLDRRYLRLLAFGCWLSLCTGLVQSAQEIFPRQVLQFQLPVLLALTIGMRLGQISISPWLGRLADRFGNRRVMLAVVPLIASGTLFYAAASPRQPAWAVGAWVAWIAFAGINICQPNLMLKLAPAEARSAYVAAFYALTGLCVAASTIAGGLLFDYLRDRTFSLLGGRLLLDCYQALFLFGWITRTLGVVILLWVIEPGRKAARGDAT
jgi:MFS family permease